MGVPTFFLEIIKNKLYKNVISPVKNGKTQCDYFFFDYNGIVYNAYEAIKKDLENKNLTKAKLEELLIDEVIRYTKYLICDVIKPKQLTYLSMDGPAPRAKMIQQRSRRYKGYADKMFLQNEKKKHGISVDKDEWDRSSNISPGTEFMQKLSNRLKEKMKSKFFMDHEPKMKMILSDGNVPGEGEHKFLDIMRSMRHLSSKKDLSIFIYSKDADLIVLSVASHKNNIHILREIKSETDANLKKMYEAYEFLDLNIDNLKEGFFKELTHIVEGQKFDKIRILNDYIFLTFLVGNDFVNSMSYLKIRKGGLKSLIAIYHEVFSNLQTTASPLKGSAEIKGSLNEYLINYHPDEPDYKSKKLEPTLNILFFTKIMQKLSEKEDELMKEQQRNLNRIMTGYTDARRAESEMKKSPYEIFSDRYTHLEICSPDHPLFSKYQADFRKIDCNKPPEVWKEQYYKYFFNIDKSNVDEYLEFRMKLVENYFESLMFTLKYYYVKCPSWTWHYKYRMPPLISDICYALEHNLFNLNDIKFTLGEPYTPFQQLMLIYPPQMDFLLPNVLRPIMTDDKLLCTQFYPVSFNLDAVAGVKTQYSEAILPEIDTELLIPVIKKYEEKLNHEEQERNKINNNAVMV